MKKLLLLCALISTFTLQASHILGGIIQVAQTSPDSTSIGLYVVSDQFPTMPTNVSVQKWAMNSQGWYELDGYVTLDKITTGTHQGFNTAMYVSDYLNLDSNKYRFIYTNCCWPILNNSSNSTSSDVVISADYWHVPNNTTPFMEQPLWVNVQSNAVNSMKPVWGIYNCHFTNPDGDSVNLHLTDIYSSYSNGVFVPQVQSSNNVLADNDSITFVGTNLGSHGYGFQIDKYRNGYLMTTQRIQWTFIVRSSTVGIEENEIEKEVLGIWDWQGRYIQKDIEMLPANRLYLIRYSDGSYDKVFLMKQN
jgi:hypothetical protein